MNCKYIITAGMLVSIAIVIAAIIMRPARYKPMKYGDNGSVVLDEKTGLIYPRGTGWEPYMQKK